MIVHEATRTSGYGAELSALVQENCFYHLEAPIERVAGWDTPYPHAFEWQYFPGPGSGCRCHAPRDGELEWAATSSNFPMSAKARPKPRSSPGMSRSATHIEEDAHLVDVMTDKATVEMTSPVSGRIVSLTASLA